MKTNPEGLSFPSEAEERLLRTEGLLVEKKVSLKEKTTFGVGGEADFLVTAESEEALREALHICTENNLPFYMLGLGSNVLVSDKGYRGVILQLGDAFRHILRDGDRLIAGAAVSQSDLASFAEEQSLTGLEFSEGILGTVGGAVLMNAGAYVSETANVVESVRLMERDGTVLTLSKDEMDFGYRTSRAEKDASIVLSAVYLLKEGVPGEIRAAMDDFHTRRHEKQPLEYGSAGSTFKRPTGYFAGKLIQDAGLRGFTIGRAAVSEKHCGFVINLGGATSAEVMAVIREVQRRVYENSGVRLEPEVRFLGEFEE